MIQKYGGKNMRPTYTDALSSTQKSMQSTSTQNNLLGESMAIKRTEVFIPQTIQVSQYKLLQLDTMEVFVNMLASCCVFVVG